MPLPSVSQLKQALKIAEKLEEAQSELASILGASSDAVKRGPGRPKKQRTMSEEAQKRRWAAQKKAASKA